MQGMWCVGGDFAVAARRIQPLVRDWRIVVAMDKVMSNARMSGLLLEDRLEDCRCLQLVCVFPVGGVKVR